MGSMNKVINIPIPIEVHIIGTIHAKVQHEIGGGVHSAAIAIVTHPSKMVITCVVKIISSPLPKEMIT